MIEPTRGEVKVQYRSNLIENNTLRYWCLLKITFLDYVIYVSTIQRIFFTTILYSVVRRRSLEQLKIHGHDYVVLTISFQSILLWIITIPALNYLEEWNRFPVFSQEVSTSRARSLSKFVRYDVNDHFFLDPLYSNSAPRKHIFRIFSDIHDLLSQTYFIKTGTSF